MPIFVTTYKRFSEIQKAMLLVTDDISAATYEINDAGVLTFFNDQGPFMSVPPGLWLLVEPAQSQQPSLIAP